MKRDIRDEWVKALRSGKYKQGNGSLRCGDHYCCLGVLCDTLGKKWVPGFGDNYRLSHTEADSFLPDSYNKTLGLPWEVEERLAKMNDDGASFWTIADYIEETL